MNYKKVNEIIGCMQKSVLLVMFCTLYICLYFNPFSGLSIDSFSREIGMAAVNNYDVGKVIRNFALYFGLVLVVFCMVSMVVGYIWICLKQRIVEEIYKEMTQKINIFCGIALIPLLLKYVEYFCNGKVQYGKEMHFLMMIVIAFVVFVLILSAELINFSNLKWTLLVTINITFFVQLVLYEFINVNTVLLFLIIYFILLVVINYINNFILQMNQQKWEQIQDASTPFAYGIFGISVIVECCNILNQYGVIVKNKILIVMFFYIGITLLAFFFFKARKSFDWNKHFSGGMLLALVCVYAQPYLQNVVSTDFFEQANISVPVSQFFLYGKMPIVESLSGHLLSDNLAGMVYGILNQDYFGALFSPYTTFFYMIWIIIFYVIIKKCFDEDYALLVCTILPISVFGYFWANLSLISVLALVLISKKQSYKNYMFFWMILAASCVYKVDTGVALGVASVISWILASLLHKKEIAWKKAISTFGIVILLFGIFFVISCFMNEISPTDRAYEFIQIIASSNQNWAYSSIGQAGNVGFVIVYFGLPLLCLAGIILYCYRLRVCTDRKVPFIYDVFTLTFGISYFVNFQRMLVRHSYFEVGFSSWLFFTAFLFLALVCSEKIYEKKEIIFSSLFCLSLFLVGLEGTSLSSQTILSGALERYSGGKMVVENIPCEKVKRVETSEEMKNIYLEVTEFISDYLNEDETFLDLSNQTLLFALTEKENPVYVSQSPGLLWGDFSQNEFIQQVEQHIDKIPIVLTTTDLSLNCGVSIDGVLNNFRYYRIYEFVYENYYPMYRIGAFVVWCHNERQDNEEVYDVQMDNLEQLYKYNIEVFWQDGVLTLKNSSDIDPQVIGLEKYFRKCNSENISIIINYTSNISGILELFYTTEENEVFTGQKVVQSYATTAGTAVFKVPYTEFSQYRLDIMENMELKIHSIKVLEGDYEYVDYDYAQNAYLHTYDIGMIPYLWGMKDSKNAAQNEVIDELELNDAYFCALNLNSYDKSNGNYISIELDSPIDTTCTLKLVDATNPAVDLSVWNFTVQSGKATYLFRVSADSYWYSGRECALQLIIGNGIEILQTKVLVGD